MSAQISPRDQIQQLCPRNHWLREQYGECRYDLVSPRRPRECSQSEWCPAKYPSHEWPRTDVPLTGACVPALSVAPRKNGATLAALEATRKLRLLSFINSGLQPKRKWEQNIT